MYGRDLVSVFINRHSSDKVPVINVYWVQYDDRQTESGTPDTCSSERARGGGRIHSCIPVFMILCFQMGVAFEMFPL